MDIHKEVDTVLAGLGESLANALPEIEVFLPSLLPGRAAVAIRYGAEPGLLYLVEQWLFLHPLKAIAIATQIALGEISIMVVRAMDAISIAIPEEAQ